MSNPLLGIVRALTPPQPPPLEGWEGIEYKWKFFHFRPALFTNEPWILLAGFLYLAVFLWGKSTNRRKAESWFQAHLPIFETQFSKPSREGLTFDGYSDAFNYSTGRRYLTRLHTVFTLRPRHDLLQLIYQFAWGMYDLAYRPKDEISLEFEFHPTAQVPDFVFAIVAKDVLSSIKDERWDLTFCKTTENPALPPQLTVMSEIADVTANLLKPLGSFSMVKAVSDPAILPYFRSLSITDQPDKHPEVPVPPQDRKKRLILSLSSPAPANAGVTKSLVESVFSLVDVLGSGKYLNLRPETKTKLKQARDKFDKDLREEAEKEKKEEAAEEKAAQKRKAEQERLAKLSAADQKKALEKERKRTLRKSQGKMVRK
ncbi:DUF1682-domain-containing protein [Punctularia strigosozonata HHB-11173 SS5]|uniref:DUF1682-domain-containing protein n=1 Tax=Punctularia strigosozonata (strain HHB-11173) TaxID=741275 RepID=UPI0004418627|nr:DUF1682-domain-containing protein [Punctularia strigosozonata HHB-11173 SS5]EIN10637.1 DUF1682-domain-containing protein [Punctularia strigosozonata HHB-11173 SS5]